MCTDHLGTPQVLTDRNQNVVCQADYRPFGETDILIQNIENPSRFPGQFFDEETGSHYNYFRDFDPTTGRYLAPDPIGLEGGISLFAYVVNNPINVVDPLGLSPETACPRKKKCSELFWEEFERNRVPGANLFGIPTGAVSSLITAVSLGGPSLGERAAQRVATGAFESQRLTQSGVYIKNYFPRFFTAANAFRLLGKVSWAVTVFYVPADITTLIYTKITFECEE